MVVDFPVFTIMALSDDYVFFNEGEIAWNKESHYFTGIQVNSPKMDEFECIVCQELGFKEIGEFLGYFQQFLMAVEADSEIRVPRGRIASGIRKALPEGPLTGITLANLAACNGAIKLAKLDNSETYSVLFDSRLGQGIPQFFNLVARMVWDLRQCIKWQTGEPFTIAFLPCRNFDADCYFGNVRKPVAGAQENPQMMEVCCAPEINLDAGDSAGCSSKSQTVSLANESADLKTTVSADEVAVENGSGDVSSTENVAGANDSGDEFSDSNDSCGFGGESSGGNDFCAPDGESSGGNDSCASDGETPERVASLAMLDMAITMQKAFGKSAIPQDIIDDAERAKNGDMSIDVDDLLRRMTEAMPDKKSVDLSNVTFNDGNIATGRRFKIAYPDGWTVVENYEESYSLVEQVRPFVIVQGEASADDDLSMFDRIIYRAADGDHEINESIRKCGFDDVHWVARRAGLYGRSNEEGLLGLIRSMRSATVWDEEIQAVNTKCLVSQRRIPEGSDRLEFYIHPYSADHDDNLMFVFTYGDGMDIEVPRNIVLKIAASVELDEPYVPECVKTLEKALSRKVSVADFVDMVNFFGCPYTGFVQTVFDTASYKFAAVTNGSDPSEGVSKESVLFSVREVVDFQNRAIPKFEKLMNAYDAQVALWHTDAELDKLLDVLGVFDTVFSGIGQFEPQIQQILNREAKDIFDELPELHLVRERLRYARQHLGEPSSNVKYQRVAYAIAAAGMQRVAYAIAAAGMRRVAYAIDAVSHQKAAGGVGGAKSEGGAALKSANSSSASVAPTVSQRPASTAVPASPSASQKSVSETAPESEQKSKLAVAQAKRIYEEARRAVDEAKCELSDAEEALEKLESCPSQCKEKRRQLDKLKADIEEVEADAQGFANEIHSYKKQIDELAADISRMRDELGAVSSAGSFLASLLTWEDFYARKDKKESLILEIDKAKKKIKELEEEQEESHSCLEEDRAWLAEHKPELVAMEQEIAELMKEGPSEEDEVMLGQLRKKVDEARAAYAQAKMKRDEAYGLYMSA